MPSQITNYQCPACTGPLHFVGTSGKLECDYCGSTFAIEEIEALYAEKDEKAEQAFSQAEAQAEHAAQTAAAEPEFTEDWTEPGMKSYNCPSCGAELVCDETTAATSCPYCGNPSIVPGQFSGMKKPDYVIPFKLSKEDAIAAFKGHYGKKFLLPASFKNENHIAEIKGVYVPFWLYDVNNYADATFTATRSHARREGDFEVITTEHFEVRRAGNIAFSRVPADGSTKMPDAYMDSIEPFDYSEMKPFSSAYLPGFLADKYDVTADENRARVLGRCENSTASQLRADVTGYATVVTVNQQITPQRVQAKYALLPVWMLSTQWNGKNYLFAMNGQTGRFVGDLPVDTRKYNLLRAGLAALFMLIAGLSGLGGALANLFF